tara:strand:+ start:2495 stop:3079 length:585 start_codon:yes stop_codon:yes gene_type:complete
MISHEYKCIFIHIPGTAGTYIEEQVCGKNWWKIEPKTKHLTASQAKEIYREYWDDYFKFSFIRHPLTRTFSLARFMNMYGVIIDKNKKVDITKYKKKYGYPLTVEHDWRFSKRKALDRHQEKCVYLNMLDEKLDFIGKYEYLEMDLGIVFRDLCIDKEVKVKPQKPYQHAFTEETKKEVYDLYEKDIKYFMYKF